MAEHDLEALRKAAHMANPNNAELHTRRWMQYHNALQAMYERGALAVQKDVEYLQRAETADAREKALRDALETIKAP